MRKAHSSLFERGVPGQALTFVVLVLINILCGQGISHAAEFSNNHVYHALVAANSKISTMRGQTLDVTQDFADAVAGDSFSDIVNYFHELDDRILNKSKYEPGKDYFFILDRETIARLSLPDSHFGEYFEFAVRLKYESSSSFQIVRVVVVDHKKYL